MNSLGEPDLPRLRTNLKALDELVRSRGWAVLVETMESEIRQAIRQVARQPGMPEAELRYRTGALWAAEQLLEMPKTLMTRIETDLMMAAAAEAKRET